MKNAVVGRLEAEDLRQQVRKVLRGLGNPEPPLRLEEVRELLRLDRQYYSSQDDGAVREFVSRVRVAGKQIIARPTLLWDVIKKAQISALWVPDRQRILIDAALPILKQRWAEGHELTHSLAPWHREFLFGDSEEELNRTCLEKLEAEANYGAGHLLFMGDRFTQETNDCETTLAATHALAKRFGNTMTSTLWRVVEEGHPELPMVGVISVPAASPLSLGEIERVRHCIESPAFKKRFAGFDEDQLLEIIDSYCTNRRGGPLGKGEALLRDVNGREHIFLFESFSNRYDVLTLGVYQRPRPEVTHLPHSLQLIKGGK